MIYSLEELEKLAQSIVRNTAYRILTCQGPMRGSKTTLLILVAEKYTKLFGNTGLLVIAPDNDTRSRPNTIESYDGKLFPALRVSADGPKEVLTLIKPTTRIIMFDEGHFFDPQKLVQVITIIRRARSGIQIIVGGLNRDFRNEDFPAMKKLWNMADWQILLEGRCEAEGCTEPGTCTQRFNIDSDGVITPAGYNDEIIVVDARKNEEPTNMYQCRCKKDHLTRKPTIVGPETVVSTSDIAYQIPP